MHWHSFIPSFSSGVFWLKKSFTCLQLLEVLMVSYIPINATASVEILENLRVPRKSLKSCETTRTLTLLSPQMLPGLTCYHLHQHMHQRTEQCISLIHWTSLLSLQLFQACLQQHHRIIWYLSHCIVMHPCGEVIIEILLG